jgi:hypothetical protein
MQLEGHGLCDVVHFNCRRIGEEGEDGIRSHYQSMGRLRVFHPA